MARIGQIVIKDSLSSFILVEKELKSMLKILSLFSGIGAFEKAITNIGLDYEVVEAIFTNLHKAEII